MGRDTPIEEVVMYRSAAMAICVAVFLVVLGMSGLAMGANPGDVIINEIYPNAPTTYDGSEFIELYNTTDSTINLTGWVLSGTEYYGMCEGEKPQRFPAGSSIPADGYIIVARDVIADANAGFPDEFGFNPDFEMFDASQYYETDDPSVPNMILDSLDAAHDDQLRLIPGVSDYSKSCGGTYNRYEALYLSTSIGGTIIDEMEYRYSSCTGDQCTGVGASDNDAYPSYPDEGLSLGRLDTSDDTDNSANDFLWEAPTPGQQNVNGIPPNIFGLSYSPCVPGPSDPVTISVYVTEVADGVQWVKCIYKQGAAAWDTLDMNQDMVEDSLYTVDLPAAPDQTQGKFYVWASDDLNVTGVYPADARSNPYGYSVGLTPISVIQEVSFGDDSSYVAGQVKNITGVVTAARGTYFDNQFVVQQGDGFWSGIHVFDPSSSVPAAVGDSVILSGRVQEYYNLTELYLFDTNCYQEVSSGHPVYETLVPTSDINVTSPFAEQWEGVLVRVDSVTVTNGDLGYGEWEINDGSGPCNVDDLAYYAYQPKTGHTIESVWGIVDYSYSEYKLQPRGNDDIVGALTLSHVRYTPHAPSTTDAVTVSAWVNTGFPIEYVYAYYNTDGGAVFDSTLMSAVNDSTYAGDIGPFPVDHTIVYYYVGAKDSAGIRVNTPDGYTYKFRVGEHTIYEVQSTFASDGDSSLFARDYEPVNLSGIVTAGAGDNPYYFFLQNSYSGAEDPAYRGVKIYNGYTPVSVARGDSVTVSGYVDEYFNETEISMPFAEALTVHSSGNTIPEAYPQSSATVDSEQWEGVLMSVRDAEIIAYFPADFGVWHITNTGNDADTCRVGDPQYLPYTPVPGTFVDVHGIIGYSYKSYNVLPRDIDDIHDPTWVGVDDPTGIPARLALVVTPNPMNLTSNVKFALPNSGRTSIRVYNTQGQMVETLVDGNIAAGEHNVHWDGTNHVGNKVTSGIYFFKLETGKGSVISKVVVSR
jgi:hypothetical protein